MIEIIDLRNPDDMKTPYNEYNKKIADMLTKYGIPETKLGHISYGINRISYNGREDTKKCRKDIFKLERELKKPRKNPCVCYIETPIFGVIHNYGVSIYYRLD